MDECAGFLPHGAFESFRTDLGLTYTQASIVLVAAAPGAIAGNVFSVLADYRSRRVIASGGAFGFAVALAGYAVGANLDRDGGRVVPARLRVERDVRCHRCRARRRRG